ncbi:uncharacterized protein LOC117416126 [Acipenser ruthenus]|uniref:uncharacterized protein LOC117416126 n=1 Tax=Acipenser ruthenus TaxID=7906 RepID=UPI0027412BE7|nr:uncharacterized protein LOC117416126 [Acipenser ruthenus]
MENEKNSSVPSTDLFESISPGSCGYIENILPVLHNSYMNPESAKCFSYNHAYLVKNDVLLEKFNFSYVEKKKKGYKPEELEESFGFLLCEQENQAKQLCETGLKVGNSSCSTLGDPTKGVYISKYSDCLDLKPWHNGKSGCIVIFRLIKGRVKAVTENYTANFPKPSVGYDCHVSEKIGTISSTSSSFQAYESTQYYIYELQNGEAVSCPRHICPFAIVGFLYSESKSSTSVLKNGKNATQDKTAWHYCTWRGQIRIKDHSPVYHVALKSYTGAVIPSKLPEKLKVDSVMKVCDLKKALPEAAFKRESYCTSEVCLDGMYCSLYEVVNSAEEEDQLHLLTEELKEKDLALAQQLNDHGLLLFLASSSFELDEENTCEKDHALQALFVFPNSRTVTKDMKAPYFVRKSEDLISRDVMQILPALNYAEMKAEKFQTDQKTPPCELVEQHLHNYATLTRPGITDSSPIRDLFPLAEQYDVSRVDKHLYRTAKCPKSAVANLKSYFSGSDAYVLPVSKALELLAVYQNEACEDADDDCEIICYSPVSSPEAEQHMCWNEGDLDDQIRTLESGNASSHEHDIHKEGKGLEMAIHEAQGGDTERMEITGAQGTDQQDALSNKNIFKILKTRDNKMPSGSSKESRGKRKKPVLPVGPKTEGPSKNSNGNNIEKRRKPMASVDQQGTDKKERSSKRLTRNSGGNGKKLLDSDDQIHPKGTTTGDELHPLKRKMKGESYRYGLKNIVTDCGRVFVPHGSKVLHTDLIPTEQTTGAEGECKTHLCKEDSLASGADSELTRSVTESFHNAVDRIAPSEPEIQKESEQPKDTQVKENELMDALKKLPPCKTNAGRGVDSVKKQKTLAPADQVVALIDSKETPTTDKPSSPKRKKQNDGNRENCELENVSVNFEKSVSPQSVQALITDSKSLEPTIGSEERPTTKKYQRKRPAGEAESSKSTKTMEETKNSNRRGKKPLAPADQKVSVIDPIENNIVDGLSPLPSIQQPKKVTKRRIVKERVNFQTRIAEYMKENGWLNFKTTSDSSENQNIQTSPSEQPMLDCERNTRLSQPSDALNLLADLALSSSTSGTTHAVQSNETSDVSKNMNTSASQENVSMVDKHVESHTVLVCEAKLTPTGLDNCETLQQALLNSNIHLNLPRTQFPQGHPVTEELILGVIVKEHSYSQPSSVLMDLTDQPPLVSTNSAGSSKAELENVNEVALVGRVAPFIHQQQPFYDCQKSKKDPSFSQNMQKSSCVKAGLSRVVFEVNGILQVTREWKESYEFALDSKYSNDPLDKCVTRALHGPWNFNIEETFEQVHLILHMWIGLFYSKSTLRFFQTDTVQSSDQSKCIFQISPSKSVTQRAPPAGSCDSQIKHLQVPSVIQKAVKEPDMEVLDRGEQSNEALDLTETNYEALDLTVPKNTKNMVPHSTSELVPSETPEESWVSNYSGSRNEDVNYTQLQDTTTAKAWSTPGKYSDKDCRADAELHKEMEDEEEDEDDNTGVSYMYPTRFLDTDKEYIELCNKATSLCIAKGKPYNGVQRTLIDDWMKRIALVAVPVNERTTKRTCIQTEKLVHIYTTDPECKEKKMCKKDEKSCNLTAALRTEKDNTISETMETITNSGGTVAVMHSDNGEDVNMQSPKELLDRNDNQKDKCLSVPEVNENILPDESVVEQKMHRENESSCNSTAVPRTEKENTISEPTETVGNSGEAVAAMHSENGEAISVQSPMMEQLLERNENQRQAILSDTEAKDSLSSDESVMEQNMCRENESSWILTEAPRSEKDDNFSEPTETVGNSSGTVAVMHSEHGEDIGNQNSQMDEFLDGNENQSEGILSDPEVYEDISSDESVVAQKICIENEISWIIVAIPRREKENTISEPTETITNYGGTVAVMDSENGEDINIQSPTIEQLLDRNENQKDECLPVSEVKENLLPDESVVEQKMHRENESSWILTKAPKSEKDDNISEPTETITDSGGTLAVLHSENGEAVHLQSPMIEQKLLERNENQREAILSDTEVKDSLLPDGSVMEQNMCRENESSWILTEAPRSKKDDNISEPTETVVNSDGAVAVMHSEHGEDIGNQSSHMDAFLDGNENQREEILSDPEVHEDISSDESVVDSKEKGSQLSNKPAHDYGACCWYSEFETDCVPVSQGRKEDLCGDSEEASSVVCSAVLDQNPAFTKTQTELVGNVDENEGSIKLHISNRGKQHTSRTYLQNMMDVDSLPISSVVHITDCWGSQKTYANFSIVKPRENVCARTVQNAQKENWQLKGFNFLKAWEEMHYTKPDLTQNTLDREYLCFSDKLNQITKRNKHTDLSEASHANGRAFSPLTITFSDLDVVPDDSLQTTDLPLRNHQITVDMPQRTAIQEANKMNEFGDNVTLPHLKKLTYVKDMREQQCEISDITTKCFQSHMSSMNHVCNGKRKELDLGTTSTDSQKRNKDFLQSSTRKPLPFQKVIDHLCTDLHQNLNAVVKESFKTKFKFYIIETKIDEFFENIKKILKKEGHAEVQLSYFDQPDEHPSGPLIVIIRNEDISTHVHRIPHLVDLKKVPSVLFAGIDSIDDVLSFNYQELFNRGGFVVCDGAVLESLELEHLKEIVNVLEELNQQGRWKWWLHYKDSKMLKENGRTVSPGHAKKFFMDCCQEAGIVEVLPYHECDLISQGKPEYLNCMLRLQVQHITARFAVFITDKADESYGNNGVLAMDINTFLTHFKTFQY